MVTRSILHFDIRPAVILIVLGLSIYAYTLPFPFLFDDYGSIVENPRIGTLWPPSRALSGAPHQTTAGRPILAFSFNLNYALSGLQAWSYRLVNLIIHLAAGLTLYAILKRFVTQSETALVIAALWLAHPLQTESVTYIVQRAESLAGLFHLLTIYFSLRGVREPKWMGWSVACCALGMGSKEVMVTAPVMAVLTDRAVNYGSFAECFAKRKKFYAVLAATWLIPAALVLSGARSRSVGFDLPIQPLDYLATQGFAMLRYLKLSIWPSDLCFDYGRWIAPHAGAWLPGWIVAGLLMLATIRAWRRDPKIGLAGAWFFLILAPTTSFIPIASQTIAEHRMYLPLAAVMAVIVCGMARLIGRASLEVMTVVILILGAITLLRNYDYRSNQAIWRDVADKKPHNSRAQTALGLIAARQLQIDDAERHFRRAIELNSRDFEAEAGLALLLQKTGRLDEAEPHYLASLALQPEDPKVRADYGLLLLNLNRPREAERQLRLAVEGDALNKTALKNLAAALMFQQRDREAEPLLRRALELDPQDADAWFNLGSVLKAIGDLPGSAAAFDQALKLRPGDAAFQERVQRHR